MHHARVLRVEDIHVPVPARAARHHGRAVLLARRLDFRTSREIPRNGREFSTYRSQSPLIAPPRDQSFVIAYYINLKCYNGHFFAPILVAKHFYGSGDSFRTTK